MEIEVVKVTDSGKGMKQFKKLPWELYKNDEYWAPELIMELHKRLNKKKHPFYEFGDADFYLAYKDGVPAGRIAAIENKRHVEFRKEHIGFWGFFECINDQEVADALFSAARQWNAQRGYPVMRGPVSCDTQDQIGMVFEGFDHTPYFIMPHNPPYYIDLCTKAGFYKAKDLIAFKLDTKSAIPPKVERIAEIAKARMEKKGFRFRNLDKKNVEHDFRQIIEVYHESWKDNWGFVPSSERQFIELANSMKLVAAAGLVIIIESPEDPDTGKREAVGMAVSLYDWMESNKTVRYLPFWLQESAQLVKLLWRLFIKKNPKFTRGRLFLAGVKPKYRGMGMDSLLYVLPFQASKKYGLVEAELSWELEDNTAILGPIEKMGAKIYRRIRVWDGKTS